MDSQDTRRPMNRRRFLQGTASVVGGATALALTGQPMAPARAAAKTQLRFWHMDYYYSDT